MQLRPYQADAKRSVFEKLALESSTLVEMATGLGKTVLFAHVASEWPGRVLVIAHRDELIRQAAGKISDVTGHAVAVEMGMERATDTLYGTKVTVASIQTLARAQRLERFHPDHFGLIVVDEGHHAVAKSYRQVLDYFTSARKLLVTATPKRADKIGLHAVCASIAYQYGIEPAIDDGWLVPIQQMVVQIDGLDFSKVRTVADDFNQGDLEQILTEEEPLHRMVASSHDIIGSRQALWFCVSVKHAQMVAAVLGRYTPEDNVSFLAGDTPRDVRRDRVAAYQKGYIQHLVNCSLFLEGFDAPATSAVVMSRPTKSLGLYMQVLGRGTRPLPGTVDGVDSAIGRRQAIAVSRKPSMVVIDFAGNAGKHKIIQALDVLEGKFPPPVRDYALQLQDEADAARAPVDLGEIAQRAQSELSLLAEEQERRKHIKANTVSYRTCDVSPFVREQSTGERQPKNAAEPCSNKQAGYICYLSRDTQEQWTFARAKMLSKKQAQGVISKLKDQVDP